MYVVSVRTIVSDTRPYQLTLGLYRQKLSEDEINELNVKLQKYFRCDVNVWQEEIKEEEKYYPEEVEKPADKAVHSMQKQEELKEKIRENIEVWEAIGKRATHLYSSHLYTAIKGIYDPSILLKSTRTMAFCDGKIAAFKQVLEILGEQKEEVKK